MNDDNFSANNQPDPAVQAPTATAVFLPQPRSVTASEGIKWIGDSWEIVKQSPGKWILINIIMFAILTFIRLFPYLNTLAYAIMLFFISGIVAICENQRKTGEADIELLFVNFQRKFITTAIVIVIQFAYYFILAMLFFVIISLSMIKPILMMMQQPNPAALLDDLSNFLPNLLLLSILIVAGVVALLFGAAMTWFTPALIINHNYKATEAILTSLKAVQKNLLPGLLFFIVMMLLLFVSAIPLGLGLLITLPISYVCYYTSYRSIFFSTSNHNQANSAQTSFSQLMQNNRDKLIE